MLSTIDWQWIHVSTASVLCVGSAVVGVFIGISIALWVSWEDWMKSDVQPKINAAVSKAVRDTEIRCREYYDEQLAIRPDGTD